MSTAIARNFQIGIDPTPTNNFTLYQPATPDGTLRLGNGNTGITSSLLTLTSAGNLGVGTSSPISSFGRSLQLYNDANTGTVASNAYLLVESLNRNAVIELAGNSTASNFVNFSDTPGTTVAGIGSFITDQNLVFRTGGTTERMRITSAGNVGIGTTSPTNAGAGYTFVTTAGSTSGAYQAFGGSATDARVFADNGFGGAGMFSNHPFLFYTNSAERMRIDSAGNVGIGTSSPTAAARLEIVGGNLRVRNTNNTASSNTTFWNGDYVGSFLWNQSNTSGAVAGIQFVNGSSANGNAGIGGVAEASSPTTSALAFYTGGSGVGGGTVPERMRIDSSGNVGIGTSSPSYRLDVVGGQASIFNSGGTANSTIRYGNTDKNWYVGLRGDTNDVFAISDDSAFRLVVDNSGNFQFNSGYGSVATAFGCRAWVNFNGQGTVAIRSSGNVSSITDLGTGLFQVNFATAMPDVNYAISTNSTWNTGVTAATTTNISGDAGTIPTASTFRIRTFVSVDGAVFDPLFVYAAVFR